MKLGQFSINQYHSGDYEFSYACKQDEYQVFKVKLTQQELTDAIFDLIHKKEQLKLLLIKLYKKAQLQADNNDELPQEILAVLNNCPEVPLGMISDISSEQDLQYWIDGFNQTYQTNFDLNDIQPLMTGL
jgi:hypothetical protein